MLKKKKRKKIWPLLSFPGHLEQIYCPSPTASLQFSWPLDLDTPFHLTLGFFLETTVGFVNSGGWGGRNCGGGVGNM